MALSISRECFPPPTKCSNCERKSRYEITKNEASKEFKRCSGCHLMSYCDKDCQVEHWDKVHKKHCKFLSGKKVAEGVKHVANSCSLCTQWKETQVRDITSCQSPKTNCHVQNVISNMKIALGKLFKFHGEGKTCSCSIELSCELPFQLGEISGAYIGCGRDEMLAHVLKILNAMMLKNSRLKDKIKQYLVIIIFMRARNWMQFLVHGHEMNNTTIIKSEIIDLMNDIKLSYGRKDAWLETLTFTASFICRLVSTQANMQCDSRSLDDPRFPNMKRMRQFAESQLKKYQENNALEKFKLWPVMTGDTLGILVPEEVHCGNCKTLLTGPVCLDLLKEDDSRPVLMTHAGELGGPVASCPMSDRSDCRVNCLKQHMFHRIQMEGLLEEYEQEKLQFYSELRFCDMCLKGSLSSHRCTACLAAQYCSTQCQRQDLDFHKTVCSSWAQDKTRRLIRGKKQVEKTGTRLKENYQMMAKKKEF